MIALDEKERGVVVVTIDDEAKKNAMSEAMAHAFAAAMAQLRRREDVRAVVVVGKGASFSAGGDLAMLERLRHASYAEARAFMLEFYGRFLSVLDVEVPVIAAVRGYAIGAGLCVATACDMMVAAHDAVLAYNFMSLGLHPGMGATYLAPRKLGVARAHELLYTARRFSGDDAVSYGLAQHAVAADEVLQHALSLAADIARLGPQSMRALKRTLAVDRAALRMALEKEAEAQALGYGHDELKEGLAAIRERRAPEF